MIDGTLTDKQVRFQLEEQIRTLENRVQCRDVQVNTLRQERDTATRSLFALKEDYAEMGKIVITLRNALDVMTAEVQTLKKEKKS